MLFNSTENPSSTVENWPLAIYLKYGKVFLYCWRKVVDIYISFITLKPCNRKRNSNRTLLFENASQSGHKWLQREVWRSREGHGESAIKHVVTAWFTKSTASLPPYRMVSISSNSKPMEHFSVEPLNSGIVPGTMRLATLWMVLIV